MDSDQNIVWNVGYVTLKSLLIGVFRTFIIDELVC
jgi:hypothetical protein